MDKKFKFANRVDEVKTAKRFSVSREEVREAIDRIESSRTQSIELSVTKRKEELQKYLEETYDRLAKMWSFESMAEMMAVAHTEMVARCIADPQTYGNKGLKALHEISSLLYAPQKATVKKTLVPGDTEELLLKRLQQRLLQQPIEPLPTSDDGLPNEDT